MLFSTQSILSAFADVSAVLWLVTIAVSNIRDVVFELSNQLAGLTVNLHAEYARKSAELAAYLALAMLPIALIYCRNPNGHDPTTVHAVHAVSYTTLLALKLLGA